MIRKMLIVVFSFLLVGGLIAVAGSSVDDSSRVQRIEADSACPAAGCASGSCHGFDNVPVPDGETEMTCPEAGCASAECHAWDSLVGRYHQASDASLNLWILAPVALVLGLVFLVRKL